MHLRSLFNKITVNVLCLFFVVTAFSALSHELHSDKHVQATARYLANEGILISVGDSKIMFDPFFHNDYGTYQLVPKDIITAIMSNAAPYDGINVIFVSHAHGDHFAAQDMLNYLTQFSSVELVAPSQAIDELRKLAGFEVIKSRLHAIELAYKDEPVHLKVKNIEVDAVRIPHAGWPSRAEVSNIVFRVTLAQKDNKAPLRFIHMGDADPNDMHFRPLRLFWEAQRTDLAFPPYWFFLSNSGNYILDYRINAQQSVGVHVPVNIPTPLIMSGKKYFSTPGEVMTLGEGPP